MSQINWQLTGSKLTVEKFLVKFELYKHQEKTHLYWWALRMCSVAVRLAPPIIQSCSTTKSFNELGFFKKPVQY